MSLMMSLMTSLMTSFMTSQARRPIDLAQSSSAADIELQRQSVLRHLLHLMGTGLRQRDAKFMSLLT
jgi:hypothetical protein